MRLIDRDKFINDMFDLYLDNKWSPEAVHFSLLDVRANIDTKAYEVKAIPIDWLVTKAKEMVLTQGTKFYSILDLPIVYDLIREWRKENETN